MTPTAKWWSSVSWNSFFEPSLLAGEERDWLKRSQEAAAQRSASPPAHGSGAKPAAHPGGSSLPWQGSWGFCSASPEFGPTAALELWWSPYVWRAPPTLLPPRSGAFRFSHRPVRQKGQRRYRNYLEPLIARHLRPATSGVLSIQDAKARRDIVLDGHPGSQKQRDVFSHHQVSMQLSVTTSVSTVIESVMLFCQKTGRQCFTP
jgi:hypothetical protein